LGDVFGYTAEFLKRARLRQFGMVSNYSLNNLVNKRVFSCSLECGYVCRGFYGDKSRRLYLGFGGWGSRYLR
jgi:hypothetical protein